jgi:predicted dehydrogenase
VCDFSEEVLTSVRSKHPAIKTVKNADDILLDKDIDLVSIASYDNYHYEQTVKALENQKHVFVEKPPCLFREEAVTIKELLKKNSFLMLSSNLNLRTCPRFRNLRALIRSGEMGEVFYFEGDYLWGRIKKLTNGWRGKMPFYSLVYGAAVHIIDLLIWLVGKEPVEVKGYGNQIATRGSGFGYTDFAVLLLRFDDGTLAKISANGGCVHPHFHKVTVYGTKQTFLHELRGGQLISSCEPHAQAKALSDDYPGKEKGMVIHSFVDSVINDDAEAAIVSADDVFNVMSVCFAAEESIHSNKTVLIDYI